MQISQETMSIDLNKKQINESEDMYFTPEKEKEPKDVYTFTDENSEDDNVPLKSGPSAGSGNFAEVLVQENKEIKEQIKEKSKRKRGRPKKTPLLLGEKEKSKRKRGRPKKIKPVPEEKSTTPLKIFEQVDSEISFLKESPMSDSDKPELR